MIRAVTFDYWQTLYAETQEVQQRRMDLMATYAHEFFMGRGREAQPRQLRLALGVLAREVGAERDNHQAGVPVDELGQRLGRIVGIALDAAEGRKLGELISWSMREEPPALVEGAREALEALHGRAKLAVISDTGIMVGADHYAVMEADGVVGLFEQFTFSDQTGTTKPLARQFLHTLHRLGCRAEEAVHVGDLERTDVLGAKGVGMRAIRILWPGNDPTTVADAAVERIAEVPGVLERWGLAPRSQG